jgi:hypothetical protein
MPDKRDRGKIHSSMEIEMLFINVIKDKQMVIHKERQMVLRGQFDQHQMKTRRSAHPRKKTNSLSRKSSFKASSKRKEIDPA